MKRLITIIIVVGLTFSFANYSGLAADGLSISIQEVCEFLAKQGFHTNQFQNLNETTKRQLIEAYERDSGLFDIKSTITDFDELKSIEYIVNTPDVKLMQQGMTEEDILETRSYIREITLKTDRELMTLFARNAVEISLLREALTPDSTYKQKTFHSDTVTTSGTIGTNKLLFDVVFVDQSYKSNKPQALALAVFQWQQCPFWTFEDTIAFAWGGGLNSKDYGMEFYLSEKSVPRIIPSQSPFSFNWTPHKTPNVGVELEFDLPWNWAWCEGIGVVTLYNTGNLTGNTAEVQAKYLHKVLAFGDISISWPPGITPRYGYDQTPAVNGRVKI